MLPKPEKNKKISSEQLDLTKTISEDDKIRQKRRILIIALILTFGISFSFWIYNSLKKFSFTSIKFSPPKLDLPRFSFSDSFNPSFKLDSNSWSIYFSTNNFTWSKNYDLSTPAPIISDLQKLSPTKDSLVKSALPEGAEIREKTIDKTDSFEVQSLVTVPQKQILFLIKVSGSNLEASKPLIPGVASSLYWSLIQSR